MTTTEQMRASDHHAVVIVYQTRIVANMDHPTRGGLSGSEPIREDDPTAEKAWNRILALLDKWQVETTEVIS